MAVFPLHNHNNGDILYPQNSFYSEECASRICSWYLTDHLYKNDKGKVKSAYRLHSCKPRTFADYMKFEVACPKCKHRMYPIQDALNYHDLALYFCKHCDKE